MHSRISCLFLIIRQVLIQFEPPSLVDQGCLKTNCEHRQFGRCLQTKLGVHKKKTKLKEPTRNFRLNFIPVQPQFLKFHSKKNHEDYIACHMAARGYFSLKLKVNLIGFLSILTNLYYFNFHLGILVHVSNSPQPLLQTRNFFYCSRI